MQEVDAERRIRLLRGLPVEDLEAKPDETPVIHHSEHNYSERDRKRRRIAGEDDTDRDIRYAKEAQARYNDDTASATRKRRHDAPLLDKDGHIDLFPDSRPKRNHTGNPEAIAEKARKERELEDQYTMRFSNAAGLKQSIDQKPWYQLNSGASDMPEALPSTNVFGRDDPNRQRRAQSRMEADDPLAAIQRGVQGVRKAEKDRKEWKESRRRELDDMVKQERREARRADRRRREEGKDELEGFSLDAADKLEADDAQHRRHKHHHRSQRRSHSRSTHRDDHRHRHRHRHHSEVEAS